MIKATHKTIQDYFRPAALPSKRELARTPVDRSFGALLQDARSESKARPPVGQNGLSIRDYMARRLNGASLRFGTLLRDHPQTSSASPANPKKNPEPKSPEPFDPSAAEGPPARRDALRPDDHAVQQAIEHAAARYGVPAGLIQSVIRSESNFRADAVSPAGAQGLMQLMPATARELGVTDPFDVHQNINGGTRYLRQMLDRFEGNVEIALAAYNAGPGTVSRYGGMPPYRETQAYVKKVLESANLLETAIL